MTKTKLSRWASLFQNGTTFLTRHAVIVLVSLVVLITALSRAQVERIGDGIQVFLPVYGLICAAANGDAARYLGRYALLEFSVKSSKHFLGDHPINARPNGRDRGFPSGHTSVAAFGAAGLIKSCLAKSPIGQSAVVLSASFTGGSRIEADKHNVWQVIVGGAFGWWVQVASLRRFDASVGAFLRAIVSIFHRRRRTRSMKSAI